ncbi:hypothetical protein [Pseudomonas palleroniana]
MPDPTISVSMGQSVTLNGESEDILSTCGLTECSALALLSKWNGTTYGKRTLMHLIGGVLTDNAYEILESFKRSLSSHDKIIWVGGSHSHSTICLAMSIGQTDISSNAPLLYLLKHSGISKIVAGSSSIAIRPNGNFELSNNPHERGILDASAIKCVFDFI